MKSKGGVAGLDSERVFLSKGRKSEKKVFDDGLSLALWPTVFLCE